MPKDEESIELGSRCISSEELTALYLGSAEGESILEARRQLHSLLRETIEDRGIALTRSGKSKLYAIPDSNSEATRSREALLCVSPTTAKSDEEQEIDVAMHGAEAG